jgi:integrase
MSRAGYWNYSLGHHYTRRSVEKDVVEFAGWEKLQSLLVKVPQYNVERNKALFVTTFLTGGRISEVLELMEKNFSVDKQHQQVTVKDMKLLKRYEKTGSWTEWVDEKPHNKLARLYKTDARQDKFFRNRYNTENKPTTRGEFRFSTGEKFADILVSWLGRSKDYLFPGNSRNHLGYSRAYKIITATGVYPHWLRAQRASCLIKEYGWPMEMMMEWMGWEELSTARHYAKYGPGMLIPGKLVMRK